MIIVGCKQPCTKRWHWTLHLLAHVFIVGIGIEFKPKPHYDIMMVGIGPFMLEVWVNHTYE